MKQRMDLGGVRLLASLSSDLGRANSAHWWFSGTLAKPSTVICSWPKRPQSQVRNTSRHLCVSGRVSQALPSARSFWQANRITRKGVNQLAMSAPSGHGQELVFSSAICSAFSACERRSKSAARGGVGRPVEKCSAQLCSGVGQENRGGAAISPYRERGTRSVCSDGDVD